MAEPALKLAPKPVEAPAADVPAPKAARQRRPLRFILLIVLPLLAAAGGVGLYLAGGRYISTDNAYVGSQKVLITPDVSGKINTVTVAEGEHVKAGQPLFSIDPVPFRLAVEQAQARVANVRTDFANVKANLGTTERMIALAQQTVKLKQSDVERKTALLARSAGSQMDLDTTMAQLVAAKTQVEQLTQQRNTLLNQLLGDPDLAIEKYPQFMMATAALDQAQRDLDHAVVRAPISGTATQVPSIQLGRYVTAGTPVFALMDDEHPWVDANPKETDVTYLRVGQPVSMKVDSFPDETFAGAVEAVSPGTGAQFAILPPQNSTGNWVKVVQRLPIRVAFAPGQDLSRLRAGMSVTVDVDTGRKRTLASIFGFEATADATHKPPAASPK
jgi:membrane fusion protein (multidrug efflux system)